MTAMPPPVPPSGAYIVIVVFEIHAGDFDGFLSLVKENAQASLDLEPGCRQFDVCVDPAQENLVLLYEAYDSEAAFDAHLGTPHFKAFDLAVKDMVRGKSIRRLQRLGRGGGPAR